MRAPSAEETAEVPRGAPQSGSVTCHASCLLIQKGSDSGAVMLPYLQALARRILSIVEPCYRPLLSSRYPTTNAQERYGPLAVHIVDLDTGQVLGTSGG